MSTSKVWVPWLQLLHTKSLMGLVACIFVTGFIYSSCDWSQCLSIASGTSCSLPVKLHGGTLFAFAQTPCDVPDKRKRDLQKSLEGADFKWLADLQNSLHASELSLKQDDVVNYFTKISFDRSKTHDFFQHLKTTLFEDKDKASWRHQSDSNPQFERWPSHDMLKVGPVYFTVTTKLDFLEAQSTKQPLLSFTNNLVKAEDAEDVSKIEVHVHILYMPSKDIEIELQSVHVIFDARHEVPVSEETTATGDNDKPPATTTSFHMQIFACLCFALYLFAYNELSAFWNPSVVMPFNASDTKQRDPASNYEQMIKSLASYVNESVFCTDVNSICASIGTYAGWKVVASRFWIVLFTLAGPLAAMGIMLKSVLLL